MTILLTLCLMSCVFKVDLYYSKTLTKNFKIWVVYSNFKLFHSLQTMSYYHRNNVQGILYYLRINSGNLRNIIQKNFSAFHNVPSIIGTIHCCFKFHLALGTLRIEYNWKFKIHPKLKLNAPFLEVDLVQPIGEYHWRISIGNIPKDFMATVVNLLNDEQLKIVADEVSIYDHSSPYIFYLLGRRNIFNILGSKTYFEILLTCLPS